MKPLKSLGSKPLCCASLLGLLLISVLSVRAQVQWDCMPLKFDYEVRVLYMDNADSTLYVGGLFRKVNGQPDTSIIGIRPDGSLRHLPYPGVNPVVVISKWNGKLLAGGFGGLSEYNGTSWQKLIPTNVGTIWSLYPYQGKLLVGGSFNDPQIPSSTYRILQQWDGATLSNFHGLDSIASGFAVGAIVEYNGDLVIGGNIIPNVGDSSKFKEILRWTGTSWQPLGTGIPGSGLDGITDIVVLNGELYAAGIFYESNGSPGNGIAKWDGAQWHRLGSGVGPGMTGVYDLAVQGDTLIVSGTFDIAGGKTAHGVARYWNGIWCGNDNPVANIATAAIDYFGTTIVAGSFNPIGGDTCRFLAKVTSWGSCFADAIAGFSQTSNATPAPTISPNPFTDIVTVRWSAKPASAVSYTLYNMTGRAIYKTAGNAMDTSLSLTHVPAGLYFLRITDAAGNVRTEKVMKQ